MSNPFWEFSLATYRTKGVAVTCLALQDDFGLDVNFLLYAAWLAQLNLRLDAQHLLELDALLADWAGQVVRPLRALRRQLAGYEAASGVREELKTLELRAEQEQQATMYAFHKRSNGLPRAKRPLQDNLVAVAKLARPNDRAWVKDIEHLVSLMPQ